MQSTDSTEINVQGAEEHDIFATEEEISNNFDLIQNAWAEYEESQVKLPYEDAIRILKKVENSVIQHGVFSPNESLKEIHTENLK